MCEPYSTLNILEQTSTTPDPALASAGLVKNINEKYKFALLWGEAQKKIAYSYPRVTYS